MTLTPEHKALVASLRSYVSSSYETRCKAADAIEALARAEDEYESVCDAMKAAEERVEALLAELRAKEAEIETLSAEVSRLGVLIWDIETKRLEEESK